MNWAPRSPSMDPDRNTPDIDAIPFSTRNRHPALIFLPQVSLVISLPFFPFFFLTLLSPDLPPFLLLSYR